MPHATLPEEAADQVTSTVAPPVTDAPPKEVATVQAQLYIAHRHRQNHPGTWVKLDEDLLQSLPSWTPLKEISQEDLNQTLPPAPVKCMKHAPEIIGSMAREQAKHSSSWARAFQLELSTRPRKRSIVSTSSQMGNSHPYHQRAKDRLSPSTPGLGKRTRRNNRQSVFICL